MAQQTAVDWLVKEFNLEAYEATVRLAKQMEREQIIAACNQTDVIGLDNEQPGEQYYTKTYGK